jgi:hypothetical protein
MASDYSTARKIFEISSRASGPIGLGATLTGWFNPWLGLTLMAYGVAYVLWEIVTSHYVKLALPGMLRFLVSVVFLCALIGITWPRIRAKLLPSPTTATSSPQHAELPSLPTKLDPPILRDHQPSIPSNPTHHVGEGFVGIEVVAAQPDHVIDLGSPIGFQVIAKNTGAEAVHNQRMFSSFIPVGELSPDFPQLSDSQVIATFHQLRQKAAAKDKKSGLTGITLDPSEQVISIVGTRDKAVTKPLWDSFYAKRTKLYLLGWTEWKTLNGLTGSNEKCMWLEPPNPPSSNPAKLWWNECDQP